MNDKLSKTSICSIVSLDIIDYSVKSEAEKLAVKNYFDSIVKIAVADIPDQDRVIVEAVNGVAISCNGPLEDALEDALFISLTVRDEILKHNTQRPTPLYVQIGINLGTVLLVNDAEGKGSLVGNGLEDAQRVMCFANPNQILVTHDYYEKASKLTHEISQMFDKYDMHTLEQDVYAVRLLKETSTEEVPSIPADISNLKPSVASKINWQYVGSVMFGLLVFFVITKVGLEPTEPNIILDEPTIADNFNLPKSGKETPALPVSKESELAETIEAKSNESASSVAVAKQIDDTQQSDIDSATKAPKKDEVITKKSKNKSKIAQKAEPSTKLSSNQNEKTQISTTTKSSETTSTNKVATTSKPTDVDVNVSAKQSESKTEKTAAKEKSAWESFKAGIAKGAERNCSQAEIAMNQCIKI